MRDLYIALYRIHNEALIFQKHAQPVYEYGGNNHSAAPDLQTKNDDGKLGE